MNKRLSFTHEPDLQHWRPMSLWVFDSSLVVNGWDMADDVIDVGTLEMDPNNYRVQWLKAVVL